MEEQANNGDYLIGILRRIRDSSSFAPSTRELAKFVLDGPESNDDNNIISRRVSLMIVCEEIFKKHPAALVEMNMHVFEFIKEIEEDDK